MSTGEICEILNDPSFVVSVLEEAKMALIALLLVGFALAAAGPIGASSYYSGSYTNSQYPPKPVIYSKGTASSYYSSPLSNYKTESADYYTTQRPYSTTMLPYTPIKDLFSAHQSYYPTSTSVPPYYSNSYSHKVYYYPSTTPAPVYYPISGYPPSSHSPSYTQQSSYYKPAGPIRVYYPTQVYPASTYYYSAAKESPVYYPSAYVPEAYTKTPSVFYSNNYQQPAYSAPTTPASYFKQETYYTTTPAYQYDQHYAQSSYTQPPYAPSTGAPAYHSQQSYYPTTTEGHEVYYKQPEPYGKAESVYKAKEEPNYSNQNSQEKYHESVPKMEYPSDEQRNYGDS